MSKLNQLKACVVSVCSNDTLNRPDLQYFRVPKHGNVREQWLDILDIPRSANTENAFVCETHFTPKDYRSPRPGRRKELKAVSVPSILLGPKRTGSKDNEDGCTEYFSGKDETPESTRKRVSVRSKAAAVKPEPVEIRNVKEEPTLELEYESGRRPSRRAALVAAKKIFNTVCHGGLKDDPLDMYDDVSVPNNTALPKKPSTTSRPSPSQKRKKKSDNIISINEAVDLDVDIECKDEELSDIQKQFLMIAEHRYNLVMKNLRELQACNVKVIRNETPGTLPFDPPVPAKNEVLTVSSSRAPNICEPAVKSGVQKVFPVKLSCAI